MENKPDQRELYLRIMHLKQEGKSDWEIEQELLMKGLDQDEAQTMIAKTDRAMARQASGEERQSSSGLGAAGGWLIWIGVLILINVLSYAFDWPFWIY